MSKTIKPSHQIQVGFYWIAIHELFWVYRKQIVDIFRSHFEINENIDFCVIDSRSSKTYQDKFENSTKIIHFIVEADPSGEIWMPNTNEQLDIPSQNEIFSISMILPVVEDFLFRQLPGIVSKKESDIPWHFNQLCEDCEYREGCRKNAINQKKISAIPNISFNDAIALRHVIQLQRQESLNQPCSEEKVTEIEELYQAFVPSDKKSKPFISHIKEKYPSIYGRVRRILKVNDSNTQINQEGPVLRSVRNQIVEVIGQKCLTFPRTADINVYLTAQSDPEHDRLFALSILALSSDTIIFNATRVATPDLSNFDGDVHTLLFNLIRKLLRIIEEQADRGEKLSVQFYVFSQSEKENILQLIIDHACGSVCGDSDEDDRDALCIGTLVDHTDALLTTIQPDLLGSGSLLGNYSKFRKQKLIEFVRLFGGPDADISGTKVELMQRLQKFIKVPDATGWKLPKIVVIHAVIKETLALPVAGFYGLQECKELLTNDNEFGYVESEEIYSQYKKRDFDAVKCSVEERNRVVKNISEAIRNLIGNYCVQNGKKIGDILVNKSPEFGAV
ncbi:hypothetical protein HK096_007851, partial [Nowakowskiella sp. JEL0078]